MDTPVSYRGIVANDLSERKKLCSPLESELCFGKPGLDARTTEHEKRKRIFLLRPCLQKVAMALCCLKYSYYIPIRRWRREMVSTRSRKRKQIGGTDGVPLRLTRPLPLRKMKELVRRIQLPSSRRNERSGDLRKATGHRPQISLSRPCPRRARPRCRNSATRSRLKYFVRIRLPSSDSH